MACLLVSTSKVLCATFAGLSTNALFSASLIRRGIDLRAFCNRFFSSSISLNSFSFLSLSIRSNSMASFFFIAEDASRSIGLRTRTVWPDVLAIVLIKTEFGS